jgi:hypothetical protein
MVDAFPFRDVEVEAVAKSLWETEKWHFMETFESDLQSVKEYFRERARAALLAAISV